MMTIRKKFLTAGALGVAIGIGVGVLYILASWLQVAEHGLPEIWTLSLFLVLLLIGVLFAALSCLILLLFRRMRLWAALILLTAVFTLVVATPLMLVAGSVRMKAFHRLEARSAPLVHAITAYTTDHGSPPETLNALIPRYLKEIPSTGMRAYPTYRYESGEEIEKLHDNPWLLYVETPLGLLNFDEIIYLPRQNYPATFYGDRLERIGTWAYRHE
jgi:hypothetical protein